MQIRRLDIVMPENIIQVINQYAGLTNFRQSVNHIHERFERHEKEIIAAIYEAGNAIQNAQAQVRFDDDFLAYAFQHFDFSDSDELLLSITNQYYIDHVDKFYEIDKVGYVQVVTMGAPAYIIIDGKTIDVTDRRESRYVTLTPPEWIGQPEITSTQYQETVYTLSRLGYRDTFSSMDVILPDAIGTALQRSMITAINNGSAYSKNQVI